MSNSSWISMVSRKNCMQYICKNTSLLQCIRQRGIWLETIFRSGRRDICSLPKSRDLGIVLVSWSFSSSSQWAFAPRKEPDFPATILLRWFNGEIRFARFKTAQTETVRLRRNPFLSAAALKLALMSASLYPRLELRRAFGA
jgi:hypothetical protein